MTKQSKQLLISAAMLAAAGLVTTVMYMNRPPSTLTEPEERVVTVEVIEVIKENIRIPIQAQGTVSPMRQTSIISEVKGRIVEVSDNLNVGNFVRKGDVLLRIDPRDYQTSLLRAQAALASAQSILAQEEGRAQVAKREWDKLPKGSQRSQQAKDLYLRIPQLELAKAQVLAAMADLNTARDNLERTIVSAPYDALIRTKETDLGEYVAPGKTLAKIFSVDYAEVRLAIPQSKLAYLDLPGVGGYTGSEAAVALYTDVSGDINHWPAKLHRTEGVFDERSRVLFTVVRIEDPYALQDSSTPRLPLRIGTFVNANISGKSISDLVTLPHHILRPGNLIWVIDRDLKLQNRKVSILRTGGDNIYVSAGLDNGELVSLTSLDATFSGARVKIISRTPSNLKQETTLEPAP
ncbi:MAG: efflux RND transporter periplasmic adaptor subunit [Proteobacteria bacterium]|nr:efflux RND transporter periplasmic adaptor subunit [Pseudomonadota bacterium]